MRRFPSMSGFSVAPAVFAVCLMIAACSSGDSNPSASDSGTGPSPSGTFVGSCKIVTTVSDIVHTGCTDYMTDAADRIKRLCDGLNVTDQFLTVVATYSADHCSRTGMAGKCTLSTVVIYFNNVQEGQRACTTEGGAWTAL